jgi:hypothetical protein
MKQDSNRCNIAACSIVGASVIVHDATTVMRSLCSSYARALTNIPDVMFDASALRHALSHMKMMGSSPNNPLPPPTASPHSHPLLTTPTLANPLCRELHSGLVLLPLLL